MLEGVSLNELVRDKVRFWVALLPGATFQRINLVFAFGHDLYGRQGWRRRKQLAKDGR